MRLRDMFVHTLKADRRGVEKKKRKIGKTNDVYERDPSYGVTINVYILYIQYIVYIYVFTIYLGTYVYT